MEKSLNSPLLNPKSPFSPNPQQNTYISTTPFLLKGRQRQNLNVSKQASTPPLFRKSSVSGKSNQSVQVVLKSANFYAERFGVPLPVLVTEALTFVDKNVSVSARVSECGYAWIVCGRRLLIWQYRQNQTQYLGTPQKKSTGVSYQCFELQLPQSDLAHRAELVSVFISSTSHTPSCIAVSPEGVVRYWPTVIHEGTSIEQVVDLQGQECDSLTDVGVIGCFLATTTCTVVLVQPHVSSGRHSLSCHTLKAPSGWLGGISKRMSSFIFGPMSTEQSAETRLVRVLSIQESESCWIVYVVAGHSLQKWRMSIREPEQLLYVFELNRFVRDGFHSSVWENCSSDLTETDTWLLDIQSNKNEILILAAAMNLHVSTQVHYALISIDANTIQSPTNISNFFRLKLTSLYREDQPGDSLSYRFLSCDSCIYLYNQRSITIIRNQKEPDTLEFNNTKDLLLGGSICLNSPIFFSRNHGLIVVSPNELADFNINSMLLNTTVDTSFNTCFTGNLSLYNIDVDEIYRAYRDTVSQLKAAFIFHIKNQHVACDEIIRELFQTDEGIFSTRGGVDASLDKVVIEISQELLNDIPASDPRWTDGSSTGLGSSYAMQVLNQLQDKQRALNLFAKFLHDVDLWNQLGSVSIRNSVMATVYVLAELAEKAVAAVSFKNLGNNKIVNEAIDKVISSEEEENERGLSKQDVFYREVTRIYRLVQEIVNRCEEVVHLNVNSNEIVQLIHESNEVILKILKDVLEFRQKSTENFSPHQTIKNQILDYLPWTAAGGSEGLLDYITHLNSLTYNYGAQMAGDSGLRDVLYDQMVNLIDIILDAHKSYLESVKSGNRKEVLLKQYQVDRHKIIAPLITDKQWERAAILAEKYLDFETLVIMCEQTNNQQRLEEYMDRFSSVGFSDFVYTWYLQKNQPGKLISRCKTVKKTKNSEHLTNFLSAYPQLAWMQNIFERRFSTAADILRNLSENEKDLITRQKTMLSVAKLAKLASPYEDPNYISGINSSLELANYCEDVPDYVLQHYGYDTAHLRVIPPKDLVYLYTCNEYKEATELDFKKALDIAQYVVDSGVKEELVLQIWRAAILRDTWAEKNLDSPLEILEQTLFYKLADLAVNLGANPQNILPPIDILVDCGELVELKESRQFQYLIKTAYEHIQRTQML